MRSLSFFDCFIDIVLTNDISYGFTFIGGFELSHSAFFSHETTQDHLTFCPDFFAVYIEHHIRTGACNFQISYPLQK